MNALWVCGINEVSTFIETHNIKKILSCLSDYPIIEQLYGLSKSILSLDENYWKNPNNWLRLNMDDIVNSNGLNAPNNEEVVKGINFGANAIKSSQPLLVHCQLGVSRSPAMAIGSLLKAGRTIEQAYGEVLAVRPRIDPNDLIIKLIDDHLKLNGELVTYNQEFKKKFRASLKQTYLEMIEHSLNNSSALNIIFENINQLNKLDKS